MEPLVLLPGMMCDARLFMSQLARFSGERVVAVAPLGIADTMEEIAARTLATSPERFALAGLSMGGIVAMEMVRQAPERITRLALLDTNHLPEDDERRAIRARQIADAHDGRLVDVMRDEMKPNYLGATRDRDEILETCMVMAKDLGPKVFELQSLALGSRIDQSRTLASYRGPTLAMCGALDTLCPPARHDAIADLMPHAWRVAVEGAGHLVTMEAPREANAALANWLAV